jgi:hypothetical protein
VESAAFAIAKPKTHIDASELRADHRFLITSQVSIPKSSSEAGSSEHFQYLATKKFRAVKQGSETGTGAISRNRHGSDFTQSTVICDTAIRDDASDGGRATAVDGVDQTLPT